MAAPQGGGQGQQDNSMGLLWILVGIFTVLVAVWYFGHDYVVYFLLKLKYYELIPVSWFTPRAEPMQYWITHTAIKHISFNQFTHALSIAGSYYAIPVAIILVILAILVYRSNPLQRYTKTYVMDKFAKEESVNWPQIGPATQLNLVEQDIDEGPWAMAVTPIAFATQHGLLRKVLQPLDPDKLSRERKILLDIDEGAANQMFTMQLGSAWTKIEALPVHMRALFGICAARANRDRAGADHLLRQLAVSSCQDKLNFAGADALCAKHKDSTLVKRVIKRHAYVLTVMASMLELARIDGVLASAEFLWLKPVDRRLWYMLNNVGRQTAFVEVAGPYAHWIAEKAFGRRIVAPMIQEATKALKLAMSEYEYKLSNDEED